MSGRADRLGQAAASGAAAVGISQGVKLGAQILSVAILARLLTPIDFGIVASVAPLTALVVLFQDFGLQQAIVQRREITQDQLSSAFWMTVALGVLCGGILVAAAPGVAAFFRDGRLLALTMATAPSLVVGSLTSVPTALLNRAMRFGTLARIDIASALAVFLAAIISALLGAQYWALPIGTLAGNLTSFVGTWRAARWRPDRLRLRLPDRGMLRFGMNMSGYGLLNFLARNLDNVLIGRFAGAIALGYYDRAYKLLLFPLTNVNAPIARIAVPLLSRIESDKPRLRDAYLRIASQVALLTIPGMAALIATADDAVGLIFGPGWHAIIPIFAWLGLAGLLQPITYSVGWLLIAQGRTATMFRWGLYSSSTAVASFVIGLHWGAVGVACSYAITDYLVRLPMMYLIVRRVGPVTVVDLAKLQGPLLLAAALTAVAARTVLRQQLGLEGLPLIVGTIALSYGLAIALMSLLPRSRAALQETVTLFRQFGRTVHPV